MRHRFFHVLFFLLLLSGGEISFSQEIICGNPDVPKFLFDDPELPAEFPGGRDSLRRFLSENLKYPSSGACISGRCYVRFIVEEDGTISNVKIIRGVQDCPECDAEAIRVTKLMPKWIPAKILEKSVKSYFDLLIRFPISG